MTGTWFDQYSARRNKSYYSSRRGDVRTIYCLTEGWGFPAKIGITSSPEARWAGLANSTWRPVYLAWTAPGTFDHEAALKYATEDDRVCGEWIWDGDDAFKGALVPDSSQAALERLICRLAEAKGLPAVRTPRPKPAAEGVQHLQPA